MAHHDLKTDAPVFETLLRGDKTHVIRFNDRNFKVGDTMTLHETQHTGEEMKSREIMENCLVGGKPLVYTGRTVGPLLITHVLEGYGLHPGWVILSFRPAVSMMTYVSWQRDPFGITFKGKMADGADYEYGTLDCLHAIGVLAGEINRRNK